MQQSELKQATRRLFVKAIRERWRAEKLERELRKFLNPLFSKDTVKRGIIKFFNSGKIKRLAEFDWFKNNLSNLEYWKHFNEIFNKAYIYNTQENERVKNAIRSIVTDGLKNDKRDGEIIAELEERTNLANYRAYTIARTATSQLSSLQFLDVAVNKAKIDRFYYEGHLPQRDFCKDHYHKVYTLEEINAESKIARVDLMLWRGGWNCVHWWEAVQDVGENAEDAPQLISYDELASFAK